MEDYTVPLDDETEMYCTLFLFADVENTGEIRKNVVDGKLRCCALKASLIIDPFQVVVAANKAALAAKCNRLTTRTLFTEVIFCLSLTKNISRSLAEFGIDDKDKNILFVFVHPDEERPRVKADIECIKGRRLPISELANYADVKLIQKTYKIEKEEASRMNLTDSIVSRISIKDFASLK